MQGEGHTAQNKDGIQPWQIKKIHALKGRLGMSDDDYRLAVQGVHGFSGTCKDLSSDEANELIELLESNAVAKGVWTSYKGKGKRRYEHLGNRPGMANPKQLRMIEAIWADVSYTHDRAKQQSALRKFLYRIVGVEAMEFVESKHVSKVITALESMQRRKRA